MKKLLALLLSFTLFFTISGCKPEKDYSVKKWWDELPVSLTETELNDILSTKFEKPKNVIIMIGDGMGPNDITLCEKYGQNNFEFGMILNKLENHGTATTYCNDSAITDSAASGTALATGVKTNLEYIGMDPNKNVLKNISEIARENGKKVGIITNDSILGATPSAFSVHAENRNDASVIANAYMDNLPDVLIGHEFSEFRKALSSENRTTLQEYAFTRNMYDINNDISTTENLDLPLITFSNEGIFKAGSDDLAIAAEIGLKRLNNKDGFFLLIENTGTDDAGHANDINGKIKAVNIFERAIAVVLKFMKENPDTLLIITSDHETGGVQLPEGNSAPDNSLFTSEEHTAADVRVFAVGKGAEYFKNKKVDNTDIAKFMIEAVKGN